MEGNNSEKAAPNVGRQQCDATSRGTLQNKLVSRVRKKKGSSLLQVESHGKDTAPKKRSVRPLLEPELNIQSSMEKIKSLRGKHRYSLVKSRLCKGVQNQTEKGNSMVELETQKVRGSLQKRKKSSTLGPLQKTWCLREKSKSLWPQQKAFGNQYERPETKRKCLSSELERCVQSLSLQKCKGGQMKGGISYCISQPQTLVPEKCLVKVKSFSVSHLSSGNLEGGTENLVKYPGLNLVEPPEMEQASGKRNGNSFTEQTLTKCYVDLGTTKQNSTQLLECVANREENKKCRLIAEEGRQRIVTRAFLKAKLCEHDGGKLNWRPEKCVATECPGYRPRSLEKQKIGIGQIVDCVPTAAPIIARVEGSSKKHADRNNEVVPSTELKIKIKTYRKQNPGVSSIRHGKQIEIDRSTSQDYDIQNLVEQSTNLPISKSDETEKRESLSSCFGRKAPVHCDVTSFPVTNTKGLQVLDIKETEKRAEKNTLTADQDDESRCLTNSPLPCKVEKNPVVRLLDCRYIKALLKPTADGNIPSNKVHCGFLHVAPGQTKVLSSSRVMGQNDLNSSPNIVEAGRSLAQKNIVIEKGMCQSRKNFSRCQNGKKQFGESKCCMDFKNPRKRIKMSKDLEKAEEKVFTNVTMSKECTQKIGEITSIADSSMTSEKLKCNGATLSSLDTSGFLLEQHTQKPPDQMVGLFDSKKVDKAHFVPYNSSEFEKSEVVESKSMEPQIDLTSQKEDEDPTVVKMLASEKITSYSSNTADHLKREKRTPKVKTISKAGRKLQLFSCQRVVPISGKNEWPRESCARTSIWVHKNHAWDSERRFLRGTDSVANSGQVELHKPLTDISEGSVNKIVECTTELPDKSSASECLPGTCNAVTAVCNENRLFSTDTEGPKQYLSTKKVKKSKETLILPGKNKGSIVKRNISIDTQNGVFADRSKREMCQKFSLAKEEQLLRTLNTRNLTNFKIPLLKNKGIVSQKIEHTRSPVKETCNPLDILENAAAVQEARATEMPSDANFGHFSKQSNITTLDTPLDKLHNGFPESRSKETCTGICNEGVAVSYENVIEPSTWQENSSSLSSGYIEKQMLDSTVASEIKGKDDSNFAQHKDNLYADILKAYEDDVLVLDVIQDDPDLFGDTNEQEATSTKEYSRNYFDASTFSKEKLELKESESSLLPRSRHLKCCPRESPIQDYGTLKSVADGYVSVIEADKVKSDSLNGTGSTGGVKESCFEDGQLTELDNLIKISDSNEKYNSLDKRGAVKEEKANFQEFAKIENAEYVEPASHDHKPELPLSAGKAVALQWQGAALKPWMNDFRFPRNVPPLPSAYPNSYDAWKVNTNDVTNLGLNGLPNRYCRLYFNTLNGCLRKTCWYLHVPESGNEKICNEILKKYISIGEVALLQRAVQIFTDYYKEVTAVVHLNSHILNELLTSLLQFCLMKELFSVFHTCITIKILPSVDLLLKVFEHVTMMKIREAVPELIDISCKLVDVGMVLEYEHFSHISKFLNQLQVSSQEITVFASRFQAGHFHKASLGDFDSAIVEFQHCKEKGDWAKLGTLYINVRRVCENFSDLEKYSLCIANTLTNSVTEDTPGVPFCVFATAVYTDSRHNEADTTLLGRIGISVLFSYYRTQQWSKAKKVLDALFALRISFTFLKGLIGQERSAPRCQIVNIAVEIFLKSGNLDGALWILRESEWVINTHSWPCDRMDVLNRHNLLCKMASEYITKSCYKEAFEVLQNLPGFQNSCDTLDVSQYSLLFNKLLADCSEGKNISISSAVTEFMLAKNIPIEFHLLRALITALGRSHLWIKARTYYKNALALGCYPPLEGNLYRKLLLIPSHMTEIEMLLAIEIFLVSNASSIQSPGASSHILQIVLKRCEGDNVRNKDDYHSAADRLIQAARISTPKLFIKHLTVNVNKEQVYSLEYAAALRWLKENMKWAGKAWLFQ